MAVAQKMQRYPIQVLVSGAGRRVMYQDYWNYGLKKNMPTHFKEYYKLWMEGPKEHIHSKPPQARFEKDEWGEIYPIQTPRIYVIYPDMFHQGMWGGEGVVKGLLKREDGNHRNFKPPAAKYWWPTLFEGVVYSEILDKHMDMVCTKRGIRLVDECAGFDKYLLSTPVNEIYATGLLRIKRELLLALSDKESFAGTVAGGRRGVYEKYEEWAVTREEADWHGLTLVEAKKKQAAIEARKLDAETVPDKLRYRKELVEMLRSGQLDEMEMELSEQTEGGLQKVFTGIKKKFK